MCGINGILELSPDGPPIDRDELRRTRDAMAARGPDGVGEWISPRGEVAFGHRRLAIIDLSGAGDQPMASPDGRYRIVFNGEIYNYRELRHSLEAEGHRFRSHSDTEVLLALWAREGEAMLPRLRGMYALALWDDLERRLVLARDPLGIKPLYYASDGGTLRFASQVRALEAGGGVSAAVEPAGVAGFLLWGSVPEPWTIRRGVLALPAGHLLVAGEGGIEAPRRHYRPGRTLAPERPDLAHALEDSVVAHLVSDVPVAIFLSAGLDSTLIAALAVRHLEEPPRTFTLRFDRYLGSSDDEGPLAAQVARALGTRHEERVVGQDEFLHVRQDALEAMDQPSIDGFNTFLVARLAAEAGIKVALSGLGGDELCGSYPSFRDVPRAARWSRALALVPGARRLWPPLVRRLVPGRPKAADLLRHPGLEGAYAVRRGLFLPEEVRPLLGAELSAGLASYDLLADVTASLGELSSGNGDRPAPDPWLAVHAMESGQYLRNQLLRDADWASMASSLEVRVPFVDAWLRDQALRLGFVPVRRSGKRELARQAAPELPAALFARRKTGFSIPVDEWLSAGPEGPEPSRGQRSRRLARWLLEAKGISLGG